MGRARCGNDGYATSKRVERGADGMPRDVLWVHAAPVRAKANRARCFAQGADAAAFAREFALFYSEGTI